MTPNSPEKLIEALERVVPVLQNSVAMTCHDDYAGMGDRIALDKIEEVISIARALLTELAELREKVKSSIPIYLHHDHSPGYSQWHIMVKLLDETQVLKRFADEGEARKYLKHFVEKIEHEPTELRKKTETLDYLLACAKVRKNYYGAKSTFSISGSHDWMENAPSYLKRLIEQKERE